MDDASLIAALQLADSFFPSGTVTLSHGLEAFISQQPSSDTDIAQLLEDYVRSKIARFDLVAYMHAYRAAEEEDVTGLQSIDEYLSASLLPQELRTGSVRSGRALLETLGPLVEAPLLQMFLTDVRTGKTAGNSAVCLGLQCVMWDIPQRTGGILLLYTFMVSFMGAALRLGCLGHREAQRILIDLRPHLSALVDEALECDLEEMGAFAPLADIRAMQHAYLPVRLFSS